MIFWRGKTVKFSEKFLMLKDIHFYLLCLVLSRPVTVLGKRLFLRYSIIFGTSFCCISVKDNKALGLDNVPISVMKKSFGQR